MTAVVRAPSGLSTYWRASREPRYSVLFALPLLLLYEALAATLSRDLTGGVRNAADVILKSVFITLGGQHGLLIFGVALIGLGCWLVARDVRAHGMRLRFEYFAAMLAESVVLALFFGVIVGWMTAGLLGTLPPFAIALQAPLEQMGWWTRLMISLGAGLYEELLFRVVLVTALAVFARRVLGWTPAVSGATAAVVGALVFSAFHYIGPFGDPWQLQSFVFRFIGGLGFSTIYLLRGFGITAWTHALYDVFLLAL
ncbi:MAG TPA: CPBP family intramembrane glutamic endopeptidase [Gemmatimonadaceae bacterium]|nr:CPBP family intramembrane glutamic endopeptidase [Gemmatimonadaceae bacterium]